MIKSILLLITTLMIGEHRLEVEIADTPALRSKGLQGRPPLKDGTGMLFIFEKPQIGNFWMKGVSFPITLGYFDENQTLVQWVDMLPALTPPYPTYKSHQPILYALEVPQGWFRKNKIRPGMKFEKITFPDRDNSVE